METPRGYWSSRSVPSTSPDSATNVTFGTPSLTDGLGTPFPSSINASGRVTFGTPLPDGAYSVQVTVTDAAGNPTAARHDFFVLAGDANRDRTVRFAVIR